MICTMSKGSQITIPAEWRAELGLAPEKEFYMEKCDNKIIIEPLLDELSLEDVQKMIDKTPISKLTPRQIKAMDVMVYG